MFITQTPLAVALSKSTLSYPAPALTTTLRSLAASKTSLSTISLRIIIALADFAASSNSLFSVYFSRSMSSCPFLSQISFIPFTASFAKGLSVATNIFMINYLIRLIVLNEKHYALSFSKSCMHLTNASTDLTGQEL